MTRLPRKRVVEQICWKRKFHRHADGDLNEVNMADYGFAQYGEVFEKRHGIRPALCPST